jgi:hypothetical protein
MAKQWSGSRLWLLHQACALLLSGKLMPTTVTQKSGAEKFDQLPDQSKSRPWVLLTQLKVFAQNLRVVPDDSFSLKSRSFRTQLRNPLVFQ